MDCKVIPFNNGARRKELAEDELILVEWTNMRGEIENFGIDKRLLAIANKF